MNRETLREKEINISHDLSTKRNVKKEKREFHEFEHKPFQPVNYKTA